MATTFARLCQQVDLTQKELENEICRLTAKIHQLETVHGRSKSLRSVSQSVRRFGFRRNANQSCSCRFLEQAILATF